MDSLSEKLKFEEVEVRDELHALRVYAESGR